MALGGGVWGAPNFQVFTDSAVTGPFSGLPAPVVRLVLYFYTDLY